MAVNRQLGGFVPRRSAREGLLRSSACDLPRFPLISEQLRLPPPAARRFHPTTARYLALAANPVAADGSRTLGNPVSP